MDFKQKDDLQQIYLKFIEKIITIFSIFLSLVMILVLIVTIYDLTVFIIKDIFSKPYFSIGQGIFETFGLFLNALIAFEILENITSYMKKHHLQVELVIATSLTAVARKIIIFEFSKYGGIELMGLALAIVGLTASYVAIKILKYKHKDQ